MNITHLGFMKKTFWLILISFIFFTTSKSQTCSHSVSLEDHYGDGWNAATLTIIVNGEVALDSITLPGGSGPLIFYFFAETGDTIDAIYTQGGWPVENEYTVYDGRDTIIGQSGIGGQTIPDNIYNMTGKCPSCFEPQNLRETNVTNTSGDLHWTSIQPASTWEYQFGPTGYIPDSIGITTTSNTVRLSNLSPRCTYDWYVRTDCGNGDFSRWSGPKVFTTASEIQSFPFIEDWEENSISTAWAIFIGDGSVLRTNDNSYSGDSALIHTGNNDYYFRSDNNYDAWIKAQPGTGLNKTHSTYNDVTIDLSNAIDAELTFFYSMNAYYYYSYFYDNYFWVVVNSGSGWSEIFSAQVIDSTIDYTKVNLSLKEYINDTLRIRFFHSARFEENYLLLDDISVLAEFPCEAPNNMIESDITVSSAKIIWSDNSLATSWEYQWGESDYSPYDTGINTEVIEAQITGLEQNTSYDWYVRSVCDSSNKSDWSGPGTFKTQVNSAEFNSDDISPKIVSVNKTLIIHNPKCYTGSLILYDIQGTQNQIYYLNGDIKQQIETYLRTGLYIFQIDIDSKAITGKVFIN